MFEARVRGASIALCALGALTLTVCVARADDFLASATDYVAKATAPSPPWDGPTTGPRLPSGHKLIAYVESIGTNGGSLGVGVGLEEAAKVTGWEIRRFDGQGTVPGRAAALHQALAIKPDGIVLGGIDYVEQGPVIAEAAAQGIKIIGWHSSQAPGAIEGSPIFTNVATDAEAVAKAAAMEVVANSKGTAGVILFTDSIYKVATAKTDAEAAVIKACSGCTLLAIEDTPIVDLSKRMPQLTTSLLAKYGSKWTYSIAINDAYFDFAVPSLQTAGIDGKTGYPRNVSAGDGSESAFQRIRNQTYQTATVAEPLKLQGWQITDELVRAFAGAPPSGYVPSPHLFVTSNVNSDGGDKNIYDPASGYREIYTKIWTGK